MRISQAFGLSYSQGELDFVDVRVDGDTAVFVDPAALRHIQGEWAQEGIALIQDFFQTVIEAIHEGRRTDAISLLSGLREPNETRLGLSSGRPRGRALGPGSAADVWEALDRSEATRTGLLQHLEDTALLVRGIGPDIVSDIATNLVRDPLIRYTAGMAEYYGIPLTQGVVSGPLWDPATHAWSEGRLVALPVASEERILLVPKSIVRRRTEYDTDEYLRKFIFPVLEDREIRADTALVRTIKYNGSKKVSQKDLIAKYGATKDDIIRVTLEEGGQPLDRYRDFREAQPSAPLDHVDFVEPTGSPLPDWDALIAELRAIAAGPATATDYHRCAERILSAIFSPSLSYPRREAEIHQGRKRVDIAFTNTGVRDFFAWLAQHHSAGNVYVECKNYTSDPANPELDQLAGRFGPTRGVFGLLCCRSFTDRAQFVQRCRDTALDDRGFIVALDDDDLVSLLEMRRDNRLEDVYVFMNRRFAEIS